jgi:exonuclease VII small subunit
VKERAAVVTQAEACVELRRQIQAAQTERAKESKDDLDRSKAHLDRAKADLKEANADLDRANADLDRAKADLDRAKADLDRAKADLDRANADLDRAKADLKEAKADLDRAKEKLKKFMESLVELATSASASASGGSHQFRLEGCSVIWNGGGQRNCCCFCGAGPIKGIRTITRAHIVADRAAGGFAPGTLPFIPLCGRKGIKGSCRDAYDNDFVVVISLDDCASDARSQQQHGSSAMYESKWLALILGVEPLLDKHVTFQLLTPKPISRTLMHIRSSVTLEKSQLFAPRFHAIFEAYRKNLQSNNEQTIRDWMRCMQTP